MYSRANMITIYTTHWWLLIPLQRTTRTSFMLFLYMSQAIIFPGESLDGKWASLIGAQIFFLLSLRMMAALHVAIEVLKSVEALERAV